MRTKIALCGVMLLGLAAAAGGASAAEEAGFYIGAGAGRGTVKIDAIDFDDSDSAFKLFGGYALNEYFALELAYFDGGTAKETAPLDPFFGQGGNASLEFETTGANLSLIANLPLAENFSLFGKVGGASIQIESRFRSPGLSASSRQTEEKLSFGAGATYFVNQSVQLRAEYEGFDIAGTDINQATVSAVFRF